MIVASPKRRVVADRIAFVIESVDAHRDGGERIGTK